MKTMKLRKFLAQCGFEKLDGVDGYTLTKNVASSHALEPKYHTLDIIIAGGTYITRWACYTTFGHEYDTYRNVNALIADINDFFALA